MFFSTTGLRCENLDFVDNGKSVVVDSTDVFFCLRLFLSPMPKVCDVMDFSPVIGHYRCVIFGEDDAVGKLSSFDKFVAFKGELVKN